MDRVDKETRSRIMSRIRGKGTKMELAAKPVLEALGFAYQPKGIYGKPDFAHREFKIAVFLDGCLFHGCPQHFKTPKSNAEFWSEKIDRNRERDAIVTGILCHDGWLVIRVWEHDLKELVKNMKK